VDRGLWTDQDTLLVLLVVVVVIDPSLRSAGQECARPRAQHCNMWNRCASNPAQSSPACTAIVQLARRLRGNLERPFSRFFHFGILAWSDFFRISAFELRISGSAGLRPRCVRDGRTPAHPRYTDTRKHSGPYRGFPIRRPSEHHAAPAAWPPWRPRKPGIQSRTAGGDPRNDVSGCADLKSPV